MRQARETSTDVKFYFSKLMLPRSKPILKGKTSQTSQKTCKLLFPAIKLFVVQSSVMSDSVTPQTAACQASMSFTNSWSLLKFTSTESVRLSNHLILCCRFSFCLQSFQASESFPMSCLFTSGGQNIGASASVSVLPMNIQD